MQTNSPVPVDASGGKLIPVIKRWSPALLGLAAGAQLHSQGIGPEVLDLLKNYGVPTALLLMGGVKLTQWVERVASFLGPEIKTFTSTFHGMAGTLGENTKIVAATAALLTEADQQAQRDRADLHDTVKDHETERQRNHAELLRELAAIKARVDHLFNRLVPHTAPHLEATIPKEGTP